MRSRLPWLAVVTLLTASCSVAAEPPLVTPPSTSSTSTSTTTTVPTSTSSSPQLDTSLINGLPVNDPESMNRRVLAVKVDNHPIADPQSGINHADMVVELMVEGITRFLTIWHESDVDYIGPVRSGRPTDSNLLPAMNHPTFAFSGAQGWVQNLISGNGVNMLKETSTGYFRISGRRAPHNLYADTNVLRETADTRDYENEPPDGPLWAFGPIPDASPPASRVVIDFSGNTVIWTWDAAQGLWLRTAYGSDSEWRDEDGTTGRISVPVMVALYVDQYTASPPGGGKGLPSSNTIGTGKAFVFAEGKVTEGTWERESIEDWFTLKDTNGGILTVPPGKIWVSLVPSNRGLSIEG
jgi:hypothetical protein